MILPTVLTVWFFVLLFGWRGALVFIYFPQRFLFSAVPGAMAGLVLWCLTAQMYPRIGPLRRIAFGAATLLTILFVEVIDNFAILLEFFANAESIIWSLAFTIVSGALAGLGCPARRLIPKTSYQSITGAS